jgi:hypothetical protein
VPLPATVVMIPVGDTRRTRPAPASAIKKLPSGSTATPIGSLKLAAVAGPPSPESPNQPVPATVLIVPSANTRRTRSLPASAIR